MKTVHSYWFKQRVVAQEFSENLLSKRDSNGIVKDFIHHAFLYSLEGISTTTKYTLWSLLIFKFYTVIGVVCYGKRLNCFSSSSEECDATVKANIDFLKALGETFHSPPWWKLWKTQAYKTIETTQDHMMAWAEQSKEILLHFGVYLNNFEQGCCTKSKRSSTKIVGG